MKAVGLVLAVLATVLVLVVVGVTVFLGSFTTEAFNRVAPGITGTPTKLGSARLQPWNGVGTLDHLRVGNPPGWQSETLASIERIHVEVDPRSLLRDTVVIRDVVIEGAVFNFETKIVSTNLGELLKQIERNVGPRPDRAPSDSAAGERRFAVQRAVLRGAKVTLGVGTSAVEVKMPDLELVDLGTPEKGLTAGQLATAATRQILSAVVSAVARSPGTLSASGGVAAEAAKEAAKQLGEGLRSLIGREKPKSP
ncbi:MAG: AsmA family protein [Verrucomicrobia bacterium]|nr:AsmA family protein [Verrucomicrobiota bacterium]